MQTFSRTNASVRQLYFTAREFAWLKKSRLRFLLVFAAVVLSVVFTSAVPYAFWTPYSSVFALVVVICTLLLGVSAGLCTSVLGALATDLFFVPPAFELDAHFFRIALSFAALALVTHFAERRFSRAIRRRFKPDQGIHGRLDGISDGDLYGWAFDGDHPAKPVALTIYTDGHPSMNLAAVHYRPDVEELLGCSGKHGFYVALRDCLSPKIQQGANVSVDVRLQDDTLLGNSPLTFKAPAVLRRPAAPVVLFMHIPKTAGSAFREAIAANFQTSEVAYLYPTPPGFLVDDLRLLPVEQRRGYRTVIGHFQFGIHQSIPGEWEYIAIVREPMARLLSQYAFLRQTRPELLQDAKGKILSLREAIEKRVSTDFDNAMVRCFSGVGESELPPGSVDAETLELATENMRRYFRFVGHQEKAAQAFVELRNLYGWEKVQTLSPVNLTEKQNPLAIEQGALDALMQNNQWDLQLYQRIVGLFPLEQGELATVPR